MQSQEAIPLSNDLCAQNNLLRRIAIRSRYFGVDISTFRNLMLKCLTYLSLYAYEKTLEPSLKSRFAFNNLFAQIFIET